MRILFLICTFLLSYTVFAQTTDWPKDIPLSSGGKITIYQPQPESLEGTKLTGRAALSVRKTAGAEPVFGAGFYEATMETDRDNRTAVLTSLKITDLKFPGASATELDSAKEIIEREVPKWDIVYSLDDIVASVQKEQKVADENFKNDPPDIIYRTKPSTLVLIDGDPIIKKDDKLKMDRVINSPFLIVKYPGDNQFYTYVNGLWYKSPSPTSGHAPVSKLPAQLADLDKQIKEQEKKDNDGKALEKPTTPPDVVVSTRSAELIQTEGEPNYVPIQGTDILYASNTMDEIFKVINDQKTYILIAGRWYGAGSLNGPWTYVPAGQVPKEFAKIPKGTEKDGVLANVAGTEEAEEAKIDAQIPQTAKVSRKDTKFEVQYDGSPKFEKIENTSLSLAENASKTVMKAANGKYYGLDNGIWFISESPNGPWVVANERPKDVENIPASSPAYNTKYVYVYDTTPDYVYVGYTPGYLGSFIYGPTVVWGTGWYYRPWYGTYYYPRPVTFGFGMSYNPWTGWSMGFGFSFNMGWFHMGFGFGGFYGGGWWGPPMYRPPYCGWGYHGGYYGGRYGYNRINSPNININRPTNININNNNVVNNFNRDRPNNLYNKRNGIQTRNIPRNAGGNLAGDNRPQNRPATKPIARPSTESGNNIFADRDGNVFQKNNNGNWNQRDNLSRDWKPANPSGGNNFNNLNRASQQRDRGQFRNNSFQNFRGGGMRGGGMRRR